MKKISVFLCLLFGLMACNDDKKYSNEEADTRQHNKATVNGEGDNGTIATDDTTSTMNNNAYNTDSASGQGTVFDSSNKR